MKQRHILAIALAVLLVGGLSGCPWLEHWLNPNKSVPLKIGVLLPLTGVWQTIGADAQTTLNVAQEQIDHYLAPLRFKTDFIVQDTGSTGAGSLAGLQVLKRKGVSLAIALVSSDDLTASVDYANKNDMMLISPSSTSVALAQPDNLLRLLPTDAHQARALAMLAQREEVGSVAVVYMNDSYGQGLKDSLDAELTERSVGLLASTVFSPSAPDYAGTVAALETALAGAGASPVAVILIVPSPFTRDLYAAIPLESPLWDVKWYGADLNANDTDLPGNAPAAAFAAHVGVKGFRTCMSGYHFYVYTDLVTRELAAATGKSDLSPWLMQTWDALWLSAETLRKNARAPFNTLKTALLEQTEHYFGATGFTHLDANGDTRTANYALYTFSQPEEGVFEWNSDGQYIEEFYADPVLALGAVEKYRVGLTKQNAGAFRLAALVPVTGDVATSGGRFPEVLQLAVEHINAFCAATCPGAQFSLDLVDTQANPGVALQQATQFAADGIDILLGLATSAEVAALEPLLAETGATAISVSSTAPSLAKDDTIVRLFPNDTFQAQALARAIERQGATDVNVLFRNDTYGQGLADAFEQEFTGTVRRLSYAADTTDFANTITSAESTFATDPSTSATLAIGYDDLILLLKQIPEGSPLLDLAWYGADGIALSPALLADPAAVAVAEQVGLSCSIFAVEGFDLFLPQIETLRYKLGIETPLDPALATAYDAMWIAALAYLSVPPEETEGREAIAHSAMQEANRMYGVSTPTFLDPYGDRSTASYVIYQVKDGAWNPRYFYRNSGFSETGLVAVEANGAP